jgi:hypothetical protein
VSVERGLIVGGRVVPGTEGRVLRDSRAWWNAGDFGTRPRAPSIDLLVGHWTGGEAGVTSYADDGPVVVANMRARTSKSTGRPLRVSITFVIGACGSADEHAMIWQCLDPAEVAAIHVGRSDVNARSIGVELVSCGIPSPFDTRRRPTDDVVVNGRLVRICSFYAGQLASFVWLADVLASARSHGIEIPRSVPIEAKSPIAHPRRRRFTLAEQRRWRGAQEHLHVPGTTKIDAAGELVTALRVSGWDGAAV